jgi:hypothetical protein
MRLIGLLAAALLMLASACGSVATGDEDAATPSYDGGMFDAGPTDDASIDAGETAAPSPPSSEVTGGAARLQGATDQMDVQIGHPSSQRPMTDGNRTIEPNTAVKP